MHSQTEYNIQSFRAGDGGVGPPHLCTTKTTLDVADYLIAYTLATGVAVKGSDSYFTEPDVKKSRIEKPGDILWSAAISLRE